MKAACRGLNGCTRTEVLNSKALDRTMLRITYLARLLRIFQKMKKKLILERI
jgi:hypothetical protein